RGVREQKVPLRVEVIQDALLLRAVQVHTSDRDGDDLGAGRFDRPGHRVVVPVLPRTHHETRVERAYADGERHVLIRIYGRVHACIGQSRRRAACDGASACHIRRIAATPWIAAPAMCSGIRSGPTPPMAMTGNPRPTISCNRARPSGARSGWVAVGNTGPTKR